MANRTHQFARDRLVPVRKNQSATDSLPAEFSPSKLFNFANHTRKLICRIRTAQVNCWANWCVWSGLLNWRRGPELPTPISCWIPSGCLVRSRSCRWPRWLRPYLPSAWGMFFRRQPYVCLVRRSHLRFFVSQWWLSSLVQPAADNPSVVTRGVSAFIAFSRSFALMTVRNPLTRAFFAIAWP
jgi:hypothetical protein